MNAHARVRQSVLHRLLQRPLLAMLPGPSTLRRRLRFASASLVLAIAFSASTFPSPGDGLDLLRASLKSGADRLLELQEPDGTWPRQLGGDGDVVTSGRTARALLAAHGVLGDQRYLAGAERTAALLLDRLGRDPRATTPGNLLFLAELGRRSGRADCLDAAREAFLFDLERRGGPAGLEAAQQLLARPNPTQWMDGAWRNYLTWSAGEVAELARAVGETRWANEFSIGLAESWVPKHDHGWYTMGAGRALSLLAKAPGPRARELAAVETAVLRNNEVIPGIAWNETPYDAFAYTMETAAALQGLLIAPDPEARMAGLDGLYWLARQQSSRGGWGATFSLFEGGVRAGSQDWVPEAELAMEESPEMDAEVVLALSVGLRTTRQLEDTRPLG